MNAVGIDVSKGKSMVAVIRPFGELVVQELSNSLSIFCISIMCLFLNDRNEKSHGRKTIVVKTYICRFSPGRNNLQFSIYLMNSQI
jgi:hypothetical protein